MSDTKQGPQGRGEAADAPLHENYFIAQTGDGDRALWRRTDNPDFPEEVMAEYQNKEIWDLFIEGRFPEEDHDADDD